jgi:hypothetical protein
MNKKYILRILGLILLVVLAVIENSFSVFGFNTGVSFYLLTYLYIISFFKQTSYTFMFLSGLVLDLILTGTPFGYFTCSLLVTGFMFRQISNYAPKEAMIFTFYVLNILVFNILFSTLTLGLIFISIIFYLISRIILFIIFKQ